MAESKTAARANAAAEKSRAVFLAQERSVNRPTRADIRALKEKARLDKKLKRRITRAVLRGEPVFLGGREVTKTTLKSEQQNWKGRPLRETITAKSFGPGYGA